MNQGPMLGCIAVDFTGATDLCNTPVKQGMRTVQALGVRGLQIGPQIDPGVPWTVSLGTCR